MDKIEFSHQLSGCLEIFYKWAARGFILGQIKEKYDTTRWYATFSTWGIHTFFYSGHYYYRWPKWTWRLNEFSEKVMNYTGITYLIIQWQKYCYRQAYLECFKKYPEFKNHCINWTEIVGNQTKEFEG